MAYVAGSSRARCSAAGRSRLRLRESGFPTQTLEHGHCAEGTGMLAATPKIATDVCAFLFPLARISSQRGGSWGSEQLFIQGHDAGRGGCWKRACWFSCFSSTFSAPVPVCALSLFSHVRLFLTLWTVVHQAFLLGFPWDFPGKHTGVGLPCPSTGDHPDPEIESVSLVPPALPMDSSPLSHWESPSLILT